MEFAHFFQPALEVIGESAVDSVIMAKRTVIHVMPVHVVLARSRAVIQHQIILLLLLFSPITICPVLRIAVLHHQDAPSPRRRVVLGEVRRLLVHHPRRHESSHFARGGGVSHAEVAAAAVHAAVHAPMLRAAVVVADALGGGASQLVELFKVFSQSSISQVTRRCPAQSAKLIMRRLKAGMEEGRVEVISAGKQTLRGHLQPNS